MFNPKFATLHYKTTSVAKPEYYAQEISDDFGWIVYPWEKDDSNPIQDYLVIENKFVYYINNES